MVRRGARVIQELLTPRVRLRAFRASDADAYADWWRDPSTRFIGGPCDRNEAWRKMAMYAGHWVLRGYGIWALERLADGALLGQAGLWFPEGWPEPEVHWALAPGFTGQGFATEAARRVRDHARDDLGWTRLVSCIAPDNTASLAVAARLGAVREGRVELPPRVFDIHRHSMER
jgi:RimJ/RimL family protein N-acetyltransferase